jgi:amino acid adenylation domain-containing protein
MATVGERRALPDENPLGRWNDTDTQYPRHLLAHQLFEEWVDRTPDAVALIVGTERLSYRQLDDRANQLAHYLRERGVGVNDYVGICMHRSIEMLVSILGVLKAGGAYVPLDASYPQKRLSGMLSSVALKGLIVSDGVLADGVTGAAFVIAAGQLADLMSDRPHDRPAPLGTPESLAYLVFTSGSTGRPKATKVKHVGWTNLLHWFRRNYSISELDRVFVVSSLSFDITQRSLLMPLVCGAELHLLPSKVFEPELLIKGVRQHGMTIINCAPSMFYTVLEWPARHSGDLRSLRWVFLGGEPIVAGRLTAWVNSSDCNARFANVYGVAECTDVSTAYTLADFEGYSRSSVPLGTPIFNTRIYLLDEDGNEVAPGEIGEICIGGAGVGLGYEGDEQLTRERFVADRFSDGHASKMYRSGDLGRIGPDLNLHYHGRVDQQVKIAGVRVEPGDVEGAIRLHPNVKDAVVIAATIQGETNLVAYVICRDSLDTRDFARALREFLRERLPSPMLPARIELTAAMPLNPNGKVDRKALAESFAAGGH